MCITGILTTAIQWSPFTEATLCVCWRGRWWRGWRGTIREIKASDEVLVLKPASMTSRHGCFAFGVVQFLELGQNEWLRPLGIDVQVVVARVASLPYPTSHTTTSWACKVSWHIPLRLNDRTIFLHDFIFRPCVDMGAARQVVVIAIVDSALQISPGAILSDGVRARDHDPRLATMIRCNLDLRFDVCTRNPSWHGNACLTVKA